MSGSSMMAELHDMFVLGRDMPAELWRQRLEKRAFQALANGLVWQADRRTASSQKARSGWRTRWSWTRRRSSSGGGR